MCPQLPKCNSFGVCLLLEEALLLFVEAQSTRGAEHPMCTPRYMWCARICSTPSTILSCYPHSDSEVCQLMEKAGSIARMSSSLLSKRRSPTERAKCSSSASFNRSMRVSPALLAISWKTRGRKHMRTLRRYALAAHMHREARCRKTREPLRRCIPRTCCTSLTVCSTTATGRLVKVMSP